MLFRVERVPASAAPSTGQVELIELVSPRTNGASFTSLEPFFAAVSREGGVSLEIGGDATARRYYVRVMGPRARSLLQAQISAVYPQTRARTASVEPGLRGPGEQVAVSRLELREPEYLPLRIPRDSDLATERAPQADPLLGGRAGPGALPARSRSVAELVPQPASTGCAPRHVPATST